MKKAKIYIILIVTLVMVNISVLYYLNTSHKMVKNGFNRRLQPHAIKYVKGINLRLNSYYLTGLNDKYIYLGNYTSPLTVLTTNWSLTDTCRYKIALPAQQELNLSAKLFIDSTAFYLLDGTTPAFLHGKTSDFKVLAPSPTIRYFSTAVPLGINSYAFRARQKRTSTYVLGKLSVQPFKLNTYAQLLKKQIDGLFCVDGILEYSTQQKKLIYLYGYRNEYQYLDTNMNLIFTGKTIDTNARAKIKIANITSSNTYTMAAPPVVVNKSCSVSDGKLFVHSNQQADNEFERKFKSSSEIDVYDLTDKGRYLFSFYINPHVDKQISSFKVFNGHLLAIHDQYLVMYQLAPKYFKP